MDLYVIDLDYMSLTVWGPRGAETAQTRVWEFTKAASAKPPSRGGAASGAPALDHQRPVQGTKTKSS